MAIDILLTMFERTLSKQRYYITAILKKEIFIMSNEKIVPKPKKRLAHGLYSKDLLLPWDDSQEFFALHDELKKEFFPCGPSEDHCVLALAQLYWQEQTLWRLRTATAVRHRFTDEIVATERRSWSGIRAGLREKAREEGSLVNTIEASVASAVTKVQRLGKKWRRAKQRAKRPKSWWRC
jgi:hypothetical protein